jgi:hypothetical protein
MKKTAVLSALFLAALLLFFASFSLGSHPLSLFVLKGTGTSVEAFKINASLNGEEPKVEAVTLSAEQKKQGGSILDEKNTAALEAFSKSFGSYGAVIGMPTTEEGWPDYLGNGLKWVMEGMPQNNFDDLQWTDRVYLAFALKVPPPEPFPAPDLSTGQTAGNNPAAVPSPASGTPTPVVFAGPVRVEILNGCGITNAADWAARRMKGQGITIVGSGNADNFQYPKTIVRTSAGIPVALEEALGRLGISKDSVEETASPDASADAVVIVGKDFPKLKGRKHVRTHH